MLLHDLRRRLVERARIHMAILRLQNLDDRLLADMGIERDAIVRRARGKL